MTQLDIWRTQAFLRINALFRSLEGTANVSDELADALIRSLSQLPNRPADKPPYAGIFAVVEVTIGRQKALKNLEQLATMLQDELSVSDFLADDLLRALSSLPTRPADKQPYASLFPAAQMIWLTSKQLGNIAPEASHDRIAQLLPHLNRTMVEFEINTPLRQAHFLAQIAHESDRFRALEEYASGEDYEEREDLGNTEWGDGVRFKGRGLIQITGRANYRNCGEGLGVDLISNPARLADPDLACRSAGWFWETNKLNSDADRDDVETITRVINGGFNGFDDRVYLLAVAKSVLSV